MTFKSERSSAQWIFAIVLALICIMITTLILIKDCKNRKIADKTYNSKIMNLTPILTFTCTIIANIFGVLSFIDGACRFSFIIYLIFANYYILMGIYQIGRLYYCFANSQVHSNRGYPNWLINCMYSIGIISIMSRTAGLILIRKFFQKMTDFQLLKK